MLKKTVVLSIGFAISFVLFCVYPFPIKCDQGKEKYKMEIKEVKLAERLTIRNPETLSVSKRSSPGDFDIYDFEIQNAIVLSLYVGNHPKFDGIGNKKARRKNINEFKLICHVWGNAHYFYIFDLKA